MAKAPIFLITDMDQWLFVSIENNKADSCENH